MTISTDGKPIRALPDGGVSLSSGSERSGDTRLFDEVLRHGDVIDEIGAGNTSDAYLFRIIRALAQGDDPNSEDLDRLLGGRNYQRGSV